MKHLAAIAILAAIVPAHAQPANDSALSLDDLQRQLDQAKAARAAAKKTTIHRPAPAKPASHTPMSAIGHPGWLTTDRGCFLWLGSSRGADLAISWSGVCRPDGNIDGQGTLFGKFQSGPSQGQSYTLEAVWQDGHLNGHGVMIYSNGMKYDGDFEEFQGTGHGIKTFPDGNKYDGEFLRGDRNGRGIETWPSGARYEGEWLNNMANGAGAYVAADGSVYNGIWTNGCFKDGDRRAAVGADLSTCP
jgi:hypothetical protein